jgi:type II secretory pathway pseudopilin PulG
MDKREPNGFVLIELVTTLILVGFIGAFVGLFLFTGVNGFLASRNNSETALKAQLALDRLSAELRQIAEIDSISSSLITYRSRDLTGTRRIRYDGTADTIYFSPNGGSTEYPLLERVPSFTLGCPVADMDQLGGDELRAITITFSLAGFSTDEVERNFNLRIFPRTLIPQPAGCP